MMAIPLSGTETKEEALQLHRVAASQVAPQSTREVSTLSSMSCPSVGDSKAGGDARHVSTGACLNGSQSGEREEDRRSASPASVWSGQEGRERVSRAPCHEASSWRGWGRGTGERGWGDGGGRVNRPWRGLMKERGGGNKRRLG